MADLKQLKIQFLEYLEIEKNRSPKTTENYDHYLNRFFDFAKVSQPAQITEELIRKFRLHLNRLPNCQGSTLTIGTLKKVTQNYHMIAVRAYLKYLAKREIESVSAEKIELGKQEGRQVEFLEAKEVERLLSSPDGSSLSDLRD